MPAARLVTLLGLVVLCLTSPLQAERPSEYEVKAAFLFNFAKFVEWPDSAFPDTSAPLSICILGDAPFGEAFVPIQGQTVRGRRLRVERHQKVDGLVDCHILFVSAARTSDLPQNVAIRRPSPDGAIVRTSLVCPSSMCNNSPVRTSLRLTLPSLMATANTRPPGRILPVQ